MSAREEDRRRCARDVLIAAADPTTCDHVLRALVATLDAERLLELADNHNVSALLHQRLATVDDVPGPLTEELAGRSRAAAAVRLHAQRTLKVLDATLGVAYIDVSNPIVLRR